MKSSKKVVTRIIGDLTSRGKPEAHWSFEQLPNTGAVVMSVRSDDGQFNAQQELSDKEIEDLINWLQNTKDQ